MAVSAPAFTAVNTRSAPAASSSTASAARSPSVKLPLAFVLTGLLALCTGLAWLVAWPAILTTYHYNQHAIALTHLFVLGWLCTTVMGAMYQLVPVALESRLYSEKLAAWHLVFHLVGFIGMVWMFWTWNMEQVGHFGSLLGLGVAFFVYNIARTLGRVPKWNVVAFGVASALTWLSLGILAGLTITIAKCGAASMFDGSPANSHGAILHGMQAVAAFMARFDAIGAMHAHAHLGAVGFFTMLIVGVSYKLVPMFTLSEIQSRRRAFCSILLLNLGLAGLFVTVLMRSSWKLGFALVIIAALAIHGWEILAIVRARKRRALDWGIRYFLTALSLFVPLSALAVALCWPNLPSNPFTGQLENAYGFLGLIGVVTLAVMGMLYKIIPFLIWFTCYSRQIGRARVPALAELYSARLQAIGYWTFLAGIVVACAGTALARINVARWGCALLVVSALTLVINVGAMLTHFFKPRIQAPLASPSAVSKLA